MKTEKLPNETTITRTPFAGSRKIYVSGTTPSIRVPMREILLSKTTDRFRNELEDNPPVTVYDTSGPYTDPAVDIDVRKGIPRLRESWIADRNDTRQLPDVTSCYGQSRSADPTLEHLRFERTAKPRTAKAGSNVSQIDRKSTRLNSSHVKISYAVFCLKK